MTEPTAELLQELKENWQSLMEAYSVPLARSQPVWDWVQESYREPWRHYHDLWHIQHMLEQLERFNRSEGDLDLLKLAVWFHDVVYKPKESDNEEASAHQAARHLQYWQLLPATIREINRLITLTKSHHTSPQDQLGHIILDADLAILGEERDRYQRYAQQIRAEYAWVEHESYQLGRSQVLQSFIQRPKIFLTKEMVDRERPARDNIRWELAQLGVR